MGKQKKCPECGKIFICDGDNDCWCENVQLHKKEFLLLNEKYTDCICESCMKKYAEE